jgi:uncharacterized protein
MRTHFISLVLALVFTSAFTGCAMDTEVGASDVAISGRPYFQVFTGTNGSHYYRFRAANHEQILSSEAYSSRTAALNGVLSVLDNGLIRTRYELRDSASGQAYFVLKASNGEVIGMSEMYSTRSNARAGVDSMVSNVGRYQDWLAERTGARFDVFQGADGRFYFNLHAANGEVVLGSQGYVSEASALHGAFSVAENGIYPALYDIRQASDGSFYFNVLAANRAIIGTSETYTSRANAERARDSIIALLPTIELL